MLHLRSVTRSSGDSQYDDGYTYLEVRGKEAAKERNAEQNFGVPQHLEVEQKRSQGRR